MKLFIRQKGVESGPYSPEQISALIKEGKLSSSDSVRVERKKLFWVPQDKNWIPVALLPGCPSDPPIRRATMVSLVWVAGLLLILLLLLASYTLWK